MPTVDLTARLARDSRPGPKDTILFDRTLPGFGLRIHPSGRKVWIVQASIEGRSRHIVIARHGEMELAEARRLLVSLQRCREVAALSATARSELLTPPARVLFRYLVFPIVPLGSRMAVREPFLLMRGGRCRSSAARAKRRLGNGFHRPTV